MTPVSNLKNIKLTLTSVEVSKIDKAIDNGYAQSRADLCRLAVIKYIEEINKERIQLKEGVA